MTELEPRVIEMTEEEVRAGRAAALAFVRIDEAELERRVREGQATVYELDAWHELEVADFFLAHL